MKIVLSGFQRQKNKYNYNHHQFSASIVLPKIKKI